MSSTLAHAALQRSHCISAMPVLLVLEHAVLCSVPCSSLCHLKTFALECSTHSSSHDRLSLDPVSAQVSLRRIDPP